MTVLLFAGCVLVGFSVPAVLFLLLVARRSQLLIVFITSAFFWLVSLLIAAILWYIISPLQTTDWAMVPLAVIIQEVTRYVFFHYYARAERSFAVVSTNAIAYPMTDLYSSAAAGLGFGVVQCLLLQGSVLSSALGVGTHFSPHCPHFSTFVLTAWNAFCFGILHIFWMIIAFDAYRQRSLLRLLSVFGSHLLAALMTLMNQNDDGCLIALPALFVITAATGVLMTIIIHQKTYRSKRRNH